MSRLDGEELETSSDIQTGERKADRRLWHIWSVLVVMSVAIHSLTLTTSPPFWIDEVQILEFGRTTLLDPKSDWSMNWTPSERPATVLSYVGPTLQHLAFRIAGRRPAGPRFAAVLGAVFAATVMIQFLRRRGAVDREALLLGAAFLLDPILTQSYRGARVDCWAIGCALAACLALRVAARPHGHPMRLAALAGCLAALSLFFWATALLLLPLVGAEAYHLLRQRWATSGRRAALSTAAFFLTAAALTATTLLLPALMRFGEFASDMRNAAEAANRIGRFASAHDLVGLLADVFKFSPILPAVGMAVLLLPFGDRALKLAAVVTISFALFTGLYSHRVIYLLPYWIVAIGESLAWPRGAVLAPARKRVLVLCVAWAASVTLVARPAFSIFKGAARDPTRLVEAARSLVSGSDLPASVCVEPYEYYYAARALNWRAYHPYAYGSFAVGAWVKTLKHCEVVIAGNPPSPEVETALRDSGFEPDHTRAGGATRDRGSYGSCRIYRRLPENAVRRASGSRD